MKNLSKEELQEAWSVTLKAKQYQVRWAFEEYRKNPATYINKHYKRINIWLEEMHSEYGNPNDEFQ